jgi:hypothetical protein
VFSMLFAQWYQDWGTSSNCNNSFCTGSCSSAWSASDLTRGVTAANYRITKRDVKAVTQTKSTPQSHKRP